MAKSTKREGHPDSTASGDTPHTPAHSSDQRCRDSPDLSTWNNFGSGQHFLNTQEKRPNTR